MAVIDIEYGREILETQTDPAAAHRRILEMEMVLQNSSYSHEYAMMKLEAAGDFLERENLHQQLEASKNAYFRARQYLQEHHPDRLQTLEKNLAEQKSRVFKTYTA